MNITSKLFSLGALLRGSLDRQDDSNRRRMKTTIAVMILTAVTAFTGAAKPGALSIVDCSRNYPPTCPIIIPDVKIAKPEPVKRAEACWSDAAGNCILKCDQKSCWVVT